MPQFRRVRRNALSDNRRPSYRRNDFDRRRPFGNALKGSRGVYEVRRNIHSMYAMKISADAPKTINCAVAESVGKSANITAKGAAPPAVDTAFSVRVVLRLNRPREWESTSTGNVMRKSTRDQNRWRGWISRSMSAWRFTAGKCPQDPFACTTPERERKRCSDNPARQQQRGGPPRTPRQDRKRDQR